MLEVTLLALEPALVPRLELHGVQRAVGHRGGDELVAAAFVAVRGARQDFVVVRGLALVGLGEHVQHGGGGHAVRGEATFGPGLTSVHLLAEEESDLLEVRFGRAEILNLGLVHLLHQHRDVGHGVEVVLEVAVLVGERTLAGGVVLRGKQERVPVARKGDETCKVKLGTVVSFRMRN